MTFYVVSTDQNNVLLVEQMDSEWAGTAEELEDYATRYPNLLYFEWPMPEWLGATDSTVSGPCLEPREGVECRPMAKYKVTSTIVSGNIDGGEPVNVQWYSGDNHVAALAALVSAAANYEDSDPNLPESLRPITLDVRLDITPDQTGATDSTETPKQWADRLGLVVRWESDWSVGSHRVAYPDAYDTEPEECLSVTVFSRHGNVLASLGCIDDPDEAYRREIEAELINEAYAEAHPAPKSEDTPEPKKTVLRNGVRWCVKHNTHRPCPGCD